ncbi:EAL and HDOD domain-containing protein [Algicola sagamiensis]|uniref:EAL and HDOD domain-containing protein n=1 Tax=Algicola sagamiensis TaxID=163869 RepID=UPI00037F738A|nr:HDOD domain-containing protein [Algicola sagamiensis]
MQVYTARQPIFNRRRQVIAYELLFREGKENRFPAHVPPDIATAKLLVNSYLSVGLEEITDNKPGLINFPIETLREHLVHMVPYKNIIIELLETIEPNHESYSLIRTLFHKGFHLALDDFVYDDRWERFLPLVKLIKVDIMETPYKDVAPLLPLFRKYKIKMLAEKVETYEEFRQGKTLEFDYFQGYFFCKPEILEGKDIETSEHFLMSIYAEVMKPEFSYKKVEEFFLNDVGLTYKLLRFVNSSLFQHSEEISSIKQAIVFLGENQIRKFVCLIVTAQLNPNKPPELIKTTIVRARFCEHMAKAIGLRKESDAAFLMGLFSTIDAILDRPMKTIMDSLPLDEGIKDALVDHHGKLASCLDASEAFLQGNWDEVETIVNQYNIDPAHIIQCLNDSMCWSKAYESAMSEG